MEVLPVQNGYTTAACLSWAGKTQKNFRHEVPKEPEVDQPRISLTFRRIEHR